MEEFQKQHQQEFQKELLDSQKKKTPAGIPERTSEIPGRITEGFPGKILEEFLEGTLGNPKKLS